MSQPAPSMMTLRIISFALMMSTVIYVVIAFIVAPGMEPMDDSSLSMLRLALAACSPGLLVAIVVIRRSMLKPLPRNTGHIELDPADKIPGSEIAQTAIARLFTPTIVGLALAEVVVIFGLLLAFLSTDPTQILPFFVVGFVAMALQFPRRSMLEALAGPR